MSSQNYYDILGIPKNADSSTIKRAYKELAKKYHPDRHKDPTKKAAAEEKFKRITEAYDCLSDAKKKQQYDTQGTFGGASGFHDFNSGGFQQGGFNMNDIFSTFFSQRGTRRRNRKTYAKKGPNCHIEISVTIEDIFHHNSKIIEFRAKDKCTPCKGNGYVGSPKTCPKCHGSGVINSYSHHWANTFFERTACDECGGEGKIATKCGSCYGKGGREKHQRLKIKIPYGVENNTTTILPEKGHYDKGGYGDLIIKFRIQENRFWKKSGNNLMTKTIVPLETILGDQEHKIMTLDQEFLAFKPKKGVYPMEIIIPNKGLPITPSKRGNLIIKLKVNIS